MRNILLITMLLGVGYSQCNESNWEEYFPEMQGCELIYADFEAVDFSGVNLYGAELVYVNFSSANLSGATIEGVNFYHTNLISANLSGTNLYGAEFYNANLVEANLSGANLEGALLYGVHLEGANLCLAISPNGDVCEESGIIIDDNQDGYDDASYDIGAESGDINHDGVLNVIDMVMFIDIILDR